MSCVCGHSLDHHSTTTGCLTLECTPWGGDPTCRRYRPVAEDLSPVGRHPFNTIDHLQAWPFDADDDIAWSDWLDVIEAAHDGHGAWGLLVQRPDMDMILVDVLDGWRDRVRRFNGRTVWCLAPSGWEP